MGGEGHIFAMIQSIKQNTQPRRNVFDKHAYRKSRIRKIKDKKATPEQLQRIREEAKAENRRVLKKRIIAIVISLGILVAGILYLISL